MFSFRFSAGDKRNGEKGMTTQKGKKESWRMSVFKIIIRFGLYSNGFKKSYAPLIFFLFFFCLLPRRARTTRLFPDESRLTVMAPFVVGLQ